MGCPNLGPMVVNDISAALHTVFMHDIRVSMKMNDRMQICYLQVTYKLFLFTVIYTTSMNFNITFKIVYLFFSVHNRRVSVSLTKYVVK